MVNKQRFNLSGKQKRELHIAFSNCEQRDLRKRLQAVYLFACGYSITDIISIVGCTRSSLHNWQRKYQQDGVQGLVDKRRRPEIHLVGHPAPQKTVKK